MAGLAKPLPEFLKVPWSIRDLVWFVVAWVGLQVGLILLLDAVSPWSPTIAWFLKAVMAGELGPSFALNVLDAGIGLGLVGMYLRRYGVGWQSLGWRRVQVWKALGYILGILIAFVVVANLLLVFVSMLVPGFDPNQAQQNEFIGAAQSHPSLALVALVLLPPVLEETIFRGFMFPAIAKRTGVIWAALISSAVFGIAHWQANIGIYTFVLGLLLCFMYVRLKSIVPGILLHMLNNYLALLALSGR